MRSPGSTPSIWRRLEALGDSEFNSGRAASRVAREAEIAPNMNMLGFVFFDPELI
jgi:hypothetical protein